MKALLILCNLAGGEKSVSELESLLSCRQAAVSQQLARLRLEVRVMVKQFIIVLRISGSKNNPIFK